MFFKDFSYDWRGKLFFVASNIFPHSSKLKTYINGMEPVITRKPDAWIIADHGLIMMARVMVRKRWSEVNVHLSVQANAVNWDDVRFWQKMGLTPTLKTCVGRMPIVWVF